MRKFTKYSFLAFFVFFIGSIISVAIFKYINPPFTPIIIIRVFENLIEGDFSGIHRVWKNYNDISPNLVRAIIAAEDARFMSHSGIDWRAVKATQSYNKMKKGKKKRGASTVTMQTAKNTFLIHSRNYFRKALEAYFTYMIEAIWGKKRIIEMYVNVVEFGPGIYGAESAARIFFNKPAKDLTRNEAALMAAVLPNPHRWSPGNPTNYIRERAKWIMGRMGSVAIPKS